MVKRVTVVEVGWSRSRFRSDGQDRGPCQIVKVKVRVRFEAMVILLDAHSHGQGQMVVTKRPSAHQAEHAQGKGQMVMTR